LWRFIKFYFFKRGFLDGGPGFAHVAIGCHNTFMKYLKMLEIETAESTSSKESKEAKSL
jgi:hypothetical protein